jgi:hypothetical protein
MQFSGAQNIIPISKEGILTPDVEPDVQGEEPDVQGEERDVDIGEPEVQGEEPEPQKEEPPVVGEGEPEVQGEDETEPEEQPEPTDPRKGVEGGLDIANTTQQSLPTAFNITIQFANLLPTYISGYSSNCNIAADCYPGPKRCADWNVAAYVQGKLVKISELKHSGGTYGTDKITGLEACIVKDVTKWYPDSLWYVPSVTVEIPTESVEDFRDYRPLSIFTVGWQNDSSTCPPPPLLNWPEELPEVQRILADYKGSIHSGAKEKIASIQHELQNQISADCSPIKPTTTKYDIETSYLQNQALDTVNILLIPPSYGMELGRDQFNGIYVRNCDTSPFCLAYYIDCPLCLKPQIE